MALIELVSPFKTFSGKTGQSNGEGGQVLFAVGRRPIARTFVRPANPNTVMQAEIRAYLASGASAFQDCTLQQKAAWTVLGAAITKRDVLGRAFTLSAIQAFQEVNLYRQIKGSAITNDAPTSASGGAVSLAQLKVALGTTKLLTTTTGAAMVFCRATNPNPLTRLARKNELRAVSNAFATSVLDVADGANELNIASPRYPWEAADFIGLEVVPLNSEFVPGASLFIAQSVVAS